MAIDWSDHGLWWPDKNIWLARTRSTLDQYGVQADATLWFTPMHKNLRIMLPDLQILDMPINFSTNVFTNVVRICRELGKFNTYVHLSFTSASISTISKSASRVGHAAARARWQGSQPPNSATVASQILVSASAARRAEVLVN